ncbi:Dynein light chain [Elasticomyces elasticus]|nr:Dynein light chain [Elasticomyces elasticus]
MADTNKDATEKPEKLEVQIKSVDMSEDMQQEAIEIAQEAMDKYNIEKVQFMTYEGETYDSLRHLQEIAHHIKRTVRKILPRPAHTMRMAC